MRTAILLGIFGVPMLLSPVDAQVNPGPRRAVHRLVAAFQPIEFAYSTAARAPGGLSETTASPDHPFLDYRMHGWFVSPSGRVLNTPGFYAADGLGGDAGSVWKVRFTPDEVGQWAMVVSFEKGPRLNVAGLATPGTPLAPHGEIQLFQVTMPDPAATGFHRHGPLEAVGARYLRHRDGTWFLKTGTNSPENLLAYSGFDGAFDSGNIPLGETFLHDYPNHVADWRPGDPEWRSGGDPHAGRGIVGALNYLHDVGVNSVYFLANNLGGDGQDVFPFVDPSGSEFGKVTHYDVGRMEQWDTVFEHAQRLGILLEFVLAERELENISWLGGAQSVQRRLYLKMMVAMFGHHPGLRWILCEENAPEPTTQFTVNELEAIAQWIRRWQSFEHPMAVHTDPDDQSIYRQILTNANDSSWLTSASLQINRADYNPATEAAHELFEQFRRHAIVDVDEQGPALIGLSRSNHAEMRRKVLWDVLLSGGNLSWYCGYYSVLDGGGDIRLEDFRSRDTMWRQSRHARSLLERYPFPLMLPADGLVTNETVHSNYGEAEVFGLPGSVYLVYYPEATTTGRIDLRQEPSDARFVGRWFNPRDGVFEGAAEARWGGGIRNVPAAPSPTWNDWVWVLERN